MTTRQYIEEFRAFSPQEQQEVLATLNGQAGSSDADGVRYIDRKEAREIGKRIFKEHSELFRKLAQ